MDKRSYKDWFKFNCAQRGHLNYLEMSGLSIMLMLFAGLFAPIFSATMGFMIIFMRELYVKLYNIDPKYRLIAILFIDIGILGELLVCVHGLVPMVLKVLF